MDPLSVTASITAVLGLTAQTIQLLSSIKNAPKERTSCATEVANLQVYLLQLQFRIEDGDPHAPWFSEILKLDVDDGPLIQYKRTIEELLDKIDTGSKTGKLGRMLAWQLIKDDVEKLLGRIERLKSLIQVALEMDHFKLSQALKEDIEELVCESRDIKEATSLLRRSTDTKQHEKLMEWISESNYSIRQADIISQRQEGTGQWFLNSSIFEYWASNPKQTLFCPGMPGAGKTMISAITIAHLQSKSSTAKEVGLCFIYFNYKTRADQDLTAVLAAMLKQLVQSRPSISKPLVDLYERHAPNKTRPSADEILSSLQSILTSYSTVHVIIDALDECAQLDNTRSQFVSQLRALQTDSDVRLMFTSRFIPEIQNEFTDIPTLEIRANDDDVRKFVIGRTDRLPKCIQRNNDLQLAVQDQIVSIVDGMFLLALLYMDALHDKNTPRAVRQAIKQLSENTRDLTRLYDNAYDEAIKRIENQLDGHRHLARNILSWITYAKRPLIVSELRHALAVEAGDEDIDSDNIYDIEDAVSVCAGLVIIDEESNIVRLVHYTTQEYFERIRLEWLPSAELAISITCFTYLSFTAFQTGPCSEDDIFEARMIEYPLMNYAASYWGDHCTPVEEEVIEHACAFLLSPSLISSASQATSAWGKGFAKFSQFYSKRTSALHLTTEFGLVSLSKRLLPRLLDRDEGVLDREDDHEYTPLMLAADNGHYELVRWLIDEGADVNAGNLDYNPLTLAAEQGFHEIVSLLIDEGAWIDKGPLQAATRAGQKHIVELLIDRGADIDKPNIDGQGPLQIASGYGHEQIVRFLLDKGAGINHKNENGGYALASAAYGGHLPIVQLLLDRGAQVNAQEVLGGQPTSGLDCAPIVRSDALGNASSKGHEQVVKLLLDHGADINAQYKHNGRDRYGSPLQAACAVGNAAVIQMLLEHGAEVNARGSGYCTALWAAINGQRPRKTVEIFLENGADIEAEVGTYGNTLTSAAERGSTVMVQLLLEKGANVNAQCGFYGNALQGASRWGHFRTAQLLLEKGAHINAKGGHHDTSLKAACYHNQTKVVQLLLDAGADLHEQSGTENTNAFYEAAGHASKEIVQLLLDKGADVNVQCGFYGNPLSVAAERWDTAVFQLLVDNGANIHAQGGYYGNALQAASARGRLESVHLLLDLGVDVNQQGGVHGNALRAASSWGKEEVVQLLLDHGAVATE